MKTAPTVSAIRSGAGASWFVGWFSKAGLAVLDQALYAGTHLFLNILLARWLTASEYGAFAVAYSVLLLVSSIHGALLLEPMMVFGSGKYSNVERVYLGALLRWHMILSAAAGVLLILLSPMFSYFYSTSVQESVLALGLSLPLALLTWFARRVFYVRLSPAGAVLGSALYCIFLLAAASSLFASGQLSPATAVLALAFSSGAAGAIQLGYLRPRRPDRDGGYHTAEVARDHWAYGRWALASGLAIWFPLNVYYIVLPYWFGLEGAGTLRAFMNLANPVLHTLTAVGMLLTPFFVRQRDTQGLDGIRRSVRRLISSFALGCGAYLVVLLALKTWLLQILYGGRYLEHSALPIVLLGLLPFGATLAIILGSTLRALERPQQIFMSYCGSSVVAMAVGLPLARIGGLSGALAGLTLSYVVAGGAMFWFLRRLPPTRYPTNSVPLSD